MTLDVKAHLRELLAKATPGEWVLNDSCEVWHSVGPGGPLTQCIDAPDAALIVAAINALPALLDRLERAEAKLLETASTCDDLERGYLDDDMSAGDLAREMRAISDDLRGVAALDDEAPR